MNAIYWVILASASVTVTQEPRVVCEALEVSVSSQPRVLEMETGSCGSPLLKLDGNQFGDTLDYRGRITQEGTIIAIQAPSLTFKREIRSCVHVPERRRTEPQPPRQIVEPERWEMRP